jgi:hypothetical protein
MIFAGEYGHPTTRKTVVNGVAVDDATTVRLRAQTAISSTASTPDQKLDVTLENTGLETLVLQLKETTERDEDTARSNLGSAQTIVAGGVKQFTVYPVKRIVEVACTSGTGTFRMQLDSQIRFDVQAFTKRDDTTLYPEELYAENFYPTPTLLEEYEVPAPEEEP